MSDNSGTAGESGGGGESGHFVDSFGEELKGNETLRSFESPEALAKAHIETSTKMADLQSKFEEVSSKVPVVPESAEGYDLSVPEGLEAFYTDESIAGFREFALKSGLSKDHAKAVFTLGANIAKHQKEATENAINALKDEYGTKWQEKIDKAQRFVKFFGSEDLAADPAVANNPGVIRMILSFSERISEDSLEHIGGNAGSQKSAAQLIFDKS